MVTNRLVKAGIKEAMCEIELADAIWSLKRMLFGLTDDALIAENTKDYWKNRSNFAD